MQVELQAETHQASNRVLVSSDVQKLPSTIHSDASVMKGFFITQSLHTIILEYGS